MHFCSQCGQEISPGDKQCKRCGRVVAYLSETPIIQTASTNEKLTKSRTSSSWKRWLIYYFATCFSVFIISYVFFSSPSLLNLFSFTKKPETPVATAPEIPSQPSVATLKNMYNRLSAGAQKAVSLSDEYRKAGVPGDPIRTAANYRRISQTADALLSDAVLPPDSPTEVMNIAVPLKESIGLLGKAGSIMADYLEGKLSLTPPNPDWVARAQDYFAQSQARLKENQQMLTSLRKKFE